MSEKSVSDRPRFVAVGNADGTIQRFMARIGFETFRSGGVVRFIVSPEVWTMIAMETTYGTAPGSRSGEHIELRMPGGFAPVIADAGLVARAAEAELADGRRAVLDMESVLW